MTNNKCWCLACCQARSREFRPKRKQRVSFWGDSAGVDAPPPRTTAYFYKHQPSYKMTVLTLNSFGDMFIY